MLRPPQLALTGALSPQTELSLRAASAAPAWASSPEVWIAVAVAVLLVAGALWYCLSRSATEHDSVLQRSMTEPVKGGSGARDNMLRHYETYTSYEDHGLLQPNYDKEQLSQGSTSMYEYSKMGFEERHEKMLFYNVDRTTGWAALFNLSHTALVNPILWRTCSVYVVVAVALAAVVRLGLEYRETRSDFVELNGGLDILAAGQMYLSALLGFMLGLFVSTIISRWWRCRMDCLDQLWGSFSDIQLFLATRCPSTEDAPMKQTVLRLCLLCHRLVYMEARGKEDRESLEALRDVHVLEAEELELLDGRQAKAQLVLVWVGRMLTELSNERTWEDKSPGTLLHLDERIRQARRAIAKVFVYVGTQLPYQYVHLLSFCVLLCNLLLAVKCGVQIGSTLAAQQPLYLARAFAQLCQVVLEPFAYHAFLDLCSELSNPFGRDFSDFPGFAYHCYMRSEGFGLQKAGETTPEALLQIARKPTS